MPSSRPLIPLVLLTGLLLSACGADMPEPPEYSWVFDVEVIPAESDCVSPLSDARKEQYTYGLVVQGDQVMVYVEDALLADGALFGTHLSYATPAPFTDHRRDDGEPWDVEWTLDGSVSFGDPSLGSSREGQETITVLYSDKPEVIPPSCQHVSDTVWTKVGGTADE